MRILGKTFEIMLVCCDIGEGELCPCMEKYRLPEMVDVGDGHMVAPVDIMTFFKSNDWYGYLLYSPENKPSEELRAKIKQKIAQNPAPRGMLMISMPGVELSEDWIAGTIPLEQILNGR